MLAWLGAVGCLALAAPAWADPEALAAGAAAEARGDRAEAALQFEKAYRSFEASVGPRHPDTLDSLRRYARSLRALGRPAAALPWAEKAAALAAELLGERHPDAIDALAELASVYGLAGRRVEQNALNERVLALRTEVLGPTDPGTLASMNNLSLGYGAVGRFKEALALAERAAGIASDVLPEDAPGRLSLMSNLAHTYGLVGRIGDQLVLNEQVLALRTRALGPRAPQTLTSMGNLAYTYQNVGRLQEAAALSERTLALRTEVLGERHQDTMFTMHNLAQAYAKLGRYAEALALVERLLPLRTEVLGALHPETLVSVHELANLYAIRGRHGEAAALYTRANEGFRATLGEQASDNFTTMMNLARTFRAMGRDDEALALSERTLALMREALGERHRLTLQSMQETVRSYRRAGRNDEAVALAERAIALQNEVLGERHPETLVGRVELAESYAAAGRTGDAVAAAEQSLARQVEVVGEQHPDTLNTLSVLGEQYGRSGRRREAARLGVRYVTGAEWQRGQPGLSGDDRRGIFEKHARAYRRFSIDNGVVGELEDGFRLAELSKARTLLDSMTAQRAGRSGTLPAAEQAQLDDIGRQVVAYEQLVARATSAEARQALEAARNELVRRHEALEAALKARFPKYAQLREPPLLDTSRLPGVVPADAVAVSYVVAPDEAVAAWLVDASGRPTFVDLGRVTGLAAAVELLRRASSDPRGLQAALDEDGQRGWRLADGSYRLLDAAAAPPSGATPVLDETQIAADLGRALLVPLAPALRGKGKWIVSPDGPLAQLPFELLLFDGRRVVETVELHYAQSLSVYALSRERQVEYFRLDRPRDMLALGDPDYDVGPRPAGRRRALLRSAPLPDDAAPAAGAFAWPALPGTAIEVNAIRELFPRGDALLGERASEARLQQLNRSGELAGYRYLHFAVHGNLSSRDPALSSLVLSQRNLEPDTDGYVTAAEWPAYDLKSDLTVLSACDSGLGTQLSGEGVMGLPFALFLAGNVNTVLSLWPVLDEAAPLFMRKFYARIAAGQSAARALVDTKREMAADPRTRHPVNWAPFILIGAG